MSGIVAKVVLSLIVWAVYLGAWLLLAVRWQARRRSAVPVPALVMRAQHEMDEGSGVGMVLFVIGLFVVTASLLLPIAGTWAVWSWGGNDGCPAGQRSIEDGTYTPILIKGVVYQVPHTVCVLDG